MQAEAGVRRVRSGGSCNDDALSRSVRFKAEDAFYSSSDKIASGGAAAEAQPSKMTLEEMMTERLRASLNE